MSTFLLIGTQSSVVRTQSSVVSMVAMVTGFGTLRGGGRGACWLEWRVWVAVVTGFGLWGGLASCGESKRFYP